MFFIQYRKDNLFGVTDTSDGVTEWYTIEQIREFLNSGVDIKGLRNGIPLCKSDYIIKDFTEAIRLSLAKFKLLGEQRTWDITMYIKNLAVEFGVVEDIMQISMDLVAETVLIEGYFNLIIDYSKEGNKIIDKVDVFNEEVPRLSKLNTGVLNHITLKVGRKNVILTISELINELSVMLDNYFCLDDIEYIGISQSDKIVRILTENSYIPIKVSSRESIECGIRLDNKIPRNLQAHFDAYMEDWWYSSDLQWGISKISIKRWYLPPPAMKRRLPKLRDVFYGRFTLKY